MGIVEKSQVQYRSLFIRRSSMMKVCLCRWAT